MRIRRFEWDGTDPAKLAREIRALQPQLGEVGEAVAEIVAAVEAEGDAAVLRFEERFGGVAPGSLRVPDEELRGAPDGISEELAAALRQAITNVREVASAETAAAASTPTDAGDAVSFRDVVVASAGAYVPSGAGAYPSTAIMCCVPARVAGVERVAVASPPGSDGSVNSAVLAACALAGATDVYAMGGAQAIAALALGTETVSPVDVLVGPGNRYVQEAKRQMVGRTGIDGIAGPSELMVVADGRSNLGWLALDLCAQAEHADDGLLIGCAADAAVLDQLQAEIEELARDSETVTDAPLALVSLPSTPTAVELANAIAPEHLELACAGADVLAQAVLYAGCVFVGPLGATAFGDYAAGSNHVLPTGGAGRFMGPLSPFSFRRRLAMVEIGEESARDLAPVVATLARAEGFPVHAESAEARVDRPSQGESK
jgi:histidinol dehydrogenase